MPRKLNCIMLIDDNPDDNFFHERVIRKSQLADNVVVKLNGTDALEYLKSKHDHSAEHPDLILLDINMPGMNGWEFMEEYQKLDKELQSRAIIVMLTSSDDPADKKKAEALPFPSDFKTKPLTTEMLTEVLGAFFD